MRHFLFNGNESPEEIKRVLVDNAEGTETMTVQKRLTEDELVSIREQLAEDSLQIVKQDEILEVAKTEHKAAVKPLRLEIKTILSTLKSQHKESEEIVYRMPNFENGMMEYVNLEGVVVSTRRLKPEEKQGNVFSMQRRVANDD